METMHDQVMKKTLFYIFTGAFVIILVLTIASVFFGFGQPTESERSRLFYTFIIETGAAVAALFYFTFGLRKSKGIAISCDDCLVKFGNKVDALAHDIEFACKVLNVQRYGGLKFRPGDFRKLWKHFAYQPESEFLALSYIPAQDWTDEYAHRILVPTKSRIETDNIRAHRVFAVDNENELATLSRIVELHKEYKVPVSYVYVDRLINGGVCKQSLNYSFILIDNNTLVLFHFDERNMTEFEVITDTKEIYTYKQQFQLIESLSSRA